MQRRSGEVRNRRLKPIQAVVQWQQVCRRKATIIASSSQVRTVERGSFGPIGASAVLDRLRHFWIVVGLTPWRFASALTLS